MVPIHRSAKALATVVRIAVLRISKPSVRKISSKDLMNWLPRSRTSAREPYSWSPWLNLRRSSRLSRS